MRQKIRKGILAYSAILFPLIFIFLSPVIIIIAASSGVINGSAIIFTCMLLFSIIGSRLFCGWLCPAGSIQDIVSNAKSKQWNSKLKNLTKYIIWVVWFLFVIFLWIKKNPHRTDFFFMFGNDIGIIISYFMVVSLIYFFALATGKRGMCHSLCWMAPFMIIGEKIADFLHIPRFRLKADSKSCISCGLCSKRCPMSIDVKKMVQTGNMDHTECVSCLECVDNCPKKVISCGISVKSNKKNQ